MIVLDTNVVSEMMKAAPDESVSGWIAEQAEASLYITSITQAEILYGIQRLGAGKRRAALEAAAEAMFSEDFARRVLAFGTDAARAYARIAFQSSNSAVSNPARSMASRTRMPRTPDSRMSKNTPR